MTEQTTKDERRTLLSRSGVVAVLAVGTTRLTMYMGWTWFQGLLAALAMMLVIAGIFWLWSFVAFPTGTLLRDEGVMGLGRWARKNVIRPILYGRRGT
jgi:hypothetical protein